MLFYKLTIFSLFFLIVLATEAQTSKKIEFGTVNQAGLLIGERGEAFSVNTINGVKKDKWFAGIGLGLDFYKHRTIPLFLDVRRDLSAKKNTPFIYVDGGVNFRWMNFIEKERFLSYSSYSTPPGFYYDCGVGLKLSGKKNRGFVISTGYSVTQVKEVLQLRWGAPTEQLLEQNPNRFNYLNRRLVLKFGIML